MTKMTLGIKIATGFGLILLIAVVLGALGVFNMHNASKNAEKMAGAYVPEVEISNGLERNFLKTRLSMVTYTFAEEDNALKTAKERYERVQERMSDARALLQKNPWLVVLAEKINVLEKALDAYYEDVLSLENAYIKKDEIRSVLDSSAKIYMKNTKDFHAGQKESMIRDIEQDKPEYALKERLDKIIWSSELIDMANALRISNFSAAARRDTDILKDGLQAFDESFDSKLEQLKAVTRLKADLDRIEEARKAGYTYADALRELLQINLLVSSIDKELKEHGESALKAAEETARAGVDGTRKLAQESDESLMTASNTMIIGLVSAVILGLILAVFIIRSITRPVIAAVKTISESNVQVVSASDQISSSAQSLAEGASTQASSVEEVSATIEESTSINNQNADNAHEADSLAKDANHAATVGNEKVKQLMSAMEKITESSERIAKIIKTIDEIAFQTNLLALNAAVEAARAGEHGLGFAVVADEVKNLAQRSANAAKETAGIIEEAIDEIRVGNQIAQDTDKAFSEILEKAEKSSALIGEIALSIKEQAEGMNQVASAMGQIDQVTQLNASSSEEAAAAAEELNAQASAMMDNVRSIADIVGFTIESDASYAPSTTGAPVRIEHQKHVSSNVPRIQKTKKNPKDGDVFPLDGDDMKEF